jgi:hypothetical protein
MREEESLDSQSGAATGGFCAIGYEVRKNFAIRVGLLQYDSAMMEEKRRGCRVFSRFSLAVADAACGGRFALPGGLRHRTEEESPTAFSAPKAPTCA